MIDLSYEIKKRYGNVKRTRGYYVYTEKNVRLIDMYLDAGMSILGRRSGQANLAAKQLLDKGLHTFLPSKMDYQLEKAVRAVLPDFQTIRFYHSQQRAVEILSPLLSKAAVLHELPVWRAFLDNSIPQEAAACLVTPVYPVPYGIIAAKAPIAEKLPPSDMVLPPLAASLAKAFFEVKRKRGRQAASAVPSRIEEKTLKQQSLLETAAAKIWQQKNCYLFPHISDSAYTALVLKALDQHIILSPDYSIPSIIPELKVYTELLNFFNGVSV
ncbi:MAG: hypothetical protein ACTTH8_06250 [Treponema sp.]